MHEERKHYEGSWGLCWGLTLQGAGHSRSFPKVHVHAQPRVAPICTPHAQAHTHTRAHTHTLLLSMANILQMADLEHVAPELEKMSKRAYHWLQTYCLHCHINLIQKLSKGPLRFISAYAFIFYFWRERRHSYDFVTCTTDSGREGLQWHCWWHAVTMLGPIYTTSKAKFMEKDDGYKFEVNIS